MEFGVGWSTYVFAHALASNKAAFSEQAGRLRRTYPFELYSIDDQQSFADLAASRIPAELLSFAHFHVSPVRMTSVNGRYATEHESLSLVNPDLIYLDGPDQFGIVNDINGFSTAHKDLMPMACDILKIEHFLTPGTIIVIDGRAANARFLRSNLQRGWTYHYDQAVDQHVFFLDEEPLGKHNRRQLEFYAGTMPGSGQA